MGSEKEEGLLGDTGWGKGDDPEETQTRKRLNDCAARKPKICEDDTEKTSDEGFQMEERNRHDRLRLDLSMIIILSNRSYIIILYQTVDILSCSICSFC